MLRIDGFPLRPSLWQVLLDANFVKNATAVNVDIYEALRHIFDTAPFGVYVSECTKVQLSEGKPHAGVIALLKHVKTYPCGHKTFESDGKMEGMSESTGKAPEDDEDEEESDDDESDVDSDSSAGAKPVKGKKRADTKKPVVFRKLTSASCLTKIASACAKRCCSDSAVDHLRVTSCPAILQMRHSHVGASLLRTRMI